MKRVENSCQRETSNKKKIILNETFPNIVSEEDVTICKSNFPKESSNELTHKLICNMRALKERLLKHHSGFCVIKDGCEV